MFLEPPRGAAGRLRARRLAIAALSATLIAALAAMPTASALASAGSSSGSGSASGPGAGALGRSAAAVRPLGAPGEPLPAGELEALLSRLPLNDLSAAQLAHYLAGLEGVGALAGLHKGLLGEQLGEPGLEGALSEAIAQLKQNPSATLGELANLEDLLPALEGKLGGLLKALLGSLLSTEQQQALEHALGSLDLAQLVGSLLNSAKSEEAPLKEDLLANLSTLAGGLFGELGGEGKLAGLPGSELAFAPKSVKEVADELHTTPEAVSGELGQTTAQLPATTTMLTAPLTKGKLAALAPAVKGLALGILGEGSEGAKGEEKGSGEKNSGEKGSGGSSEGSGKGSGEGTGSGTGGQGGPGGSGSGGSTGSTTILLTLPGASSAQSAATAKGKLGKVTILSHRVRGHVATVVLQVPAAGTVTLTGGGLRSTGAQTAKAEHLTLRVSLSKATAASLRGGRHRRLPVKLKASFRPTSGSGSTATATITFA
jgi:hypothetical protein